MRHTSFLAVFLVVVCGDARANHAPPDTNAVLTELQSLQASLTSASTPGSERAAIADRALKLRADLIEAAPEDDRASSWMLDQAEAILARAAYDGADASVLFGIPTPAQRTRIADAASQSAAYVDRAGPAAAKFVARLQDSIFRAKDAPAAQLKELATRAESRMNAIVDTDQAWREPLLRARCAVLISATEAPATRNVRLRDALTSLARITPPPGRAEEVQRLTFAAAAIALRDDTGALLAARQQLQRLVHQTPAPDPLTIAQARAATALTALSAGEALAGAHELRTALASDPAKTGQPFGLADLILAEGAARVIIAFPSPDSSRSSWLEDGFSGLVGIMDSESRSGDAAFIAALARAKIGAATDPAMPFSALPAQIAFARAVTLASGPSALPIRPGETDEPALLLAMVAQRTDASSDLRADALWELSVVQLQKRPEPERLRAADTLCRLAESFPASRRVRQAAEAAPAIARSAVLASTTNEERARALAVYRRALAIAVAQTPSVKDAPVWRYERARILVEDSGASLEEVTLKIVLDLLNQSVPPDGQPGSGVSLRLSDELAQVAITRALSARNVSVGTARQAVEWANARNSTMIWVFQLRLGEALLEANDPSALVLFTQLTDAPGGDGHDGTRPDPNRVRLGLGRAQRLAGDNRSAFVTLRALADDLDQTPSAEPVRAGKNPRPDAYWGACAEMLEILALDNASGDRAPEIRLQLNRLALIDPGFGPEPWRSRILKVRDSIK